MPGFTLNRKTGL